MYRQIALTSSGCAIVLLNSGKWKCKHCSFGDVVTAANLNHVHTVNTRKLTQNKQYNLKNNSQTKPDWQHWNFCARANNVDRLFGWNCSDDHNGVRGMCRDVMCGSFNCFDLNFQNTNNKLSYGGLYLLSSVKRHRYPSRKMLQCNAWRCFFWMCTTVWRSLILSNGRLETQMRVSLIDLKASLPVCS